MRRCRFVEGQHRATPSIQLDHRLDARGQFGLASTVGKTANTGQQLRERHRGDSDISCERHEPCDDTRVGLRPEDLRDDIGVENDHPKSTARATSLRSGSGRSSTPPTSCATCMSATPMWGLRAALVRMSRTSASIERPCSFVCVASCFFTDSSSPRTMMDVIRDHLPTAINNDSTLLLAEWLAPDVK